MSYLILKFVHVVGAAVLLGTGAGIAFFMLMAHVSGKPTVIAGVARIVVIADFLFTATAVVSQPVTGVLLAKLLGYSLWEGWIAWSIVLYSNRRVLASRRVDADAYAQPRGGGGQGGLGHAGCLSQALPALVRFRLSGLRRCACDLLADDCQARASHLAIDVRAARPHRDRCQGDRA